MRCRTVKVLAGFALRNVQRIGAPSFYEASKNALTDVHSPAPFHRVLPTYCTLLISLGVSC
jgi:hypothetical protein